MPPPDRDLLRKLADWPTLGLPVTTLYLDVDGRRYPRRADVEGHAESLLGTALRTAERLDRDGHGSTCRDVQAIRDYLGDRFDRGGVRGLALFSCSGAGLWHDQPLPRAIRDGVAVRPRPYLLPLEALVERTETLCVALVNREKARILVARLGEIDELTAILDEVPGRHDQGGWAQARLQRHVEDHVLRHLKHVGGALLRLQQRRRFDHLVLAGPDELVAELERDLHDYLRRAIVDRASLPITASTKDLLAYVQGVEARLEREREESTVALLLGEAGAPGGRAVVGLDETLEALAVGRVDTLVVAAGLAADGVRCPRCGRLASAGARCPVCGARTVEEPDLVEEAVEAALRSGSKVETIPPEARGSDQLERSGAIGALLRF